jgi:hypothetical protein
VKKLLLITAIASLVFVASEAMASAKVPNVVCWHGTGIHNTWLRKAHPYNCNFHVRNRDRFYKMRNIHWEDWKMPTGPFARGRGQLLAHGRLRYESVTLFAPRTGWGAGHHSYRYYSKVVIGGIDGDTVSYHFPTDVPHHSWISY